MKLEINFKGNKNIKATHKSTFEITKDNFLTKKGNCIIGILSTHSVKDIPDDIKEYLKNEGKIKIIIEVDDLIDEIIAYGSKNLKFNDERSIVVRKSNYFDDRTLAINSNKAAKDIDRRIIEKLREEKEGKFIIITL